jgi:two-component system CheB/CheR fusion protein
MSEDSAALDGKTQQGDQKSPSPDSDSFLIVGLGASAGGIQALKKFFAKVPKDSDIAYVVILHMSPEHESRLAEVLQSSAAIPVTQVGTRIKVQPNNIYVIPPNRNLSMSDGHLTPTHMIGMSERRSPVDLFFRTLAETNDSRAVSVVLSGTGSNGSIGLKRIKEHGGIALAQDLSEAEYGDMPRNAIATGMVDYILPVSEMPARILSYKQHRRPIVAHEPKEAGAANAQALREIFTHLRVRTGHDFSNYKRGTMLRRIERRMGLRELSDLPSYSGFLRDNPNESQLLMKDFLISVTNFFRDPESIDALAKTILPGIFINKGNEDQVRVWVAGCATGEEAYTIAIVLNEALNASANNPQVQIFATDLDSQAIAFAREGFYSEAEVADISPERLRRYFTKEHEGYRIRHELRETILFATHNVIKDPPFSHVDLISCRNLLIYLNRGAQSRLLEVMHFALNPTGYLFLGVSESIEGSIDLFSTVDKEHHIYQGRPVPSRPVFPTPDVSFPSVTSLPIEKAQSPAEIRAIERLSYIDLHQRLLEHFAPPSVVVNEEHDIVHLSENAGRFMMVTGGEPTNNLLKLIRPELRMELRTALFQAVQNRIQVKTDSLQVRTDNGLVGVEMLVRPVLREGDPKRGYILVVFEDTGKVDTSIVSGEVAKNVEPIARHLEDELMHSQSQLRATVEQYEIQTEELRASNEELQSTNEELRSAAEELETSKEELQSVNEELTTVNQELKIKIEELSQANDDFTNLMNSTDIGTIFLDPSFNVKLFTPRARDIFNLISSDIGRPLLDITNNLLYDNLFFDIEQVTSTLQKFETEVQTSDGTWYIMRVLPYRTTENRIEGIVLTFFNISESKAAKVEVERARGELEVKVAERTSDLQQSNIALSTEIDERRRSEIIRSKLLNQLVRAQEAERRRLARDLHDQLGQQLTALRLKLENLKGEVEREQVQNEVEALLVIMDQLDSDVDYLAWELRPVALDDLGLSEALRVYLRRWSEHFNVDAEYHTGGFDVERLSFEIENNLYRIAQEALNNIAKHADAPRVNVLLERREPNVVLIIEDSGTGFVQAKDQSEETMGISGMRERASLLGGEVEIESTPGEGTTVFVRIPLRFRGKLNAGGKGA